MPNGALLMTNLEIDMNPNYVLVLLAIIWFGIVEGTHAGAAAEARPNVVLVMCDDLGWGDVGFNGNTVIKTPHLDAMAASGMKFTRFYAAAPVCSPTRGSWGLPR